MLNKINKLVQALALSAIMFGAAFQNAYATSLSISNIPLFLGNSVQPNVFFLLDDSGSMDWEILMKNHWTYAAYDTDPRRQGTFNSSDLITRGDFAHGNDTPVNISLDTDGRPYIYANSNSHLRSFYYLYNNGDNAYGASCSTGAEVCNTGATSPSTLDWRIRSSGANVTFFNPDSNYLPWNGSCGTASTSATCADADFRNARSNPKNGQGGYGLQRDLATNGDTQGGAFVYDVLIDDSGFDLADGRPRRGDNYNETGIAAGVVPPATVAVVAPNGLADLWDTHIRIQMGAGTATISRITYDPQPSTGASPGINETTQVLGSVTGSACFDVLGPNANVLAIHAQGATPSVSGVNGAGCRTIAQAQTNIANWYQYSRRRMYALKGAITQVMDAQSKFGYGINKFRSQNLFTEVPSVNDNITNHNLTLKHDLYRNTQQAIGTDLLAGMRSVGEYFRGNRSNVANPIQASCQKHFEILFTDGFWNDTLTTYGDIDSDNAQSDTGADIARFYYMKDLDSDSSNDIVSPDAGSEADLDPDGNGKTWQHLVAFTVAFGIQGAMTDGDGDGWPDTDVGGGAWTSAGIPDADGNWGNPASTSGSVPSKVDDLWHIAWNTNGAYAAASSPEEVVEKLIAAILNVASRIGSASAVALNSGTLNANTRIYQAKFNSTDWSGDLESTPVKPPVEIDPITLLPKAIPATCTTAQAIGSVCGSEWSASAELEALAFGSRNIFSRNTTTDAGIVFAALSTLDTAQQAALRTDPDTGLLESATRGQERLDWIRGSDAGTGLRKRPGASSGSVKKLGDIISSSPVFVGKPDSLLPDSLESDKYSTFVTTNKNRTKMIYVGANDGMLHGFKASDGSEAFAYAPGYLVNKLNQLTSINYQKKHIYSVDGSPQVFDVYTSAASPWKTVLSTSAGAGGQLVFGLDITDPDNFGATDSLWEFSDVNDIDMGYITGNVKFARMKNNQWVVIFGNGFNNTEADGRPSTTGNGVIYVVDAYTGALVKKFDTQIGMADDPTGANRPNGIAEVTPVDVDGDLNVDYLYAGDLFGNLWKVDVSSNVVTAWDFAYLSGTTPKAFYTAKDSSGAVQPITTGISVKRHPENGQQALVLFGTGQYFEVGDNQVNPSSQVQSFYSIWDDGIAGSAAPYTRTNLLQHQVENQVDLDNIEPLTEDFRTTSSSLNSSYVIDWGTCSSCAKHKGWYIDLLYNSSNSDYPTEYGERVVRKPVLRGDRVVFVTLIPDIDPCGFGGTSWIMELDANTGSRLPDSPFDVNKDGIIDSKDFLKLSGANTIVSGVRSKDGIVATPGILNNPKGGEFKYFSGTSGNVGVVQESVKDRGLKRQSYRQLR